MRDLLISGDRIVTSSGTLVAGVNDIQTFTPQAGKKQRILSLMFGSGGSFRWYIETVGGDLLWTTYAGELIYDSGIEIREEAILRVDASFGTDYAMTASVDEVPL